MAIVSWFFKKKSVRLFFYAFGTSNLLKEAKQDVKELLKSINFKKPHDSYDLKMVAILLGMQIFFNPKVGL